MKTKRAIFISKLIIGTAILFVGTLFFLHHIRANSISLSAPQNGNNIIYSSSYKGNPEINSLSLTGMPAPLTLRSDGTQESPMELFLSPNRKIIAVTITPQGDDVWPLTYLANLDGTKITSAHSGTFVSWTPDSSKVLLYYSPTEAPWIRKIYALGTQDQYYDFGLPNGTISADVSPLDGSVLYSFTSGGSDNSTLYVRDPQGKDSPILKGSNNIFAWVRWSPAGDKIAFLKSDLSISHGELWVGNPDGTGQSKVSSIDWNYPPVWAPDGSKMVFSKEGNIWEASSLGKTLNLTNFVIGDADHPNYSADGKMVIFISGNQLWKVENDTVTQLTNDNKIKDFPILP